MKIEGNRPSLDSEQLKRADAAKLQDAAKANKTTDRIAADKADRVDVSDGAKQVQGLVADAVKSAQALPDIRPEAVARGRARLESGELGADAGKLADALINDLLK